MTHEILSMAGRRPRVAVISTTARSREYGRRALRLLGCTPLIFINLNEFLEVGELSQELSMILLEHSPPSPQDNPRALKMGDEVREAVGEKLPIVHSVAEDSDGAVPGFRTNDMLLKSVRSFPQLYRVLREFLLKRSLPVLDTQLEWGAYRFCIETGMVFVDGKPVSLKPDEFDLALELFFNAGSQISRLWLRTMVPGLQTLRRRPTAPAADASLLRIRDTLSLFPKHGWELQLNPGLSCMLVQSDYVA